MTYYTLEKQKIHAVIFIYSTYLELQTRLTIKIIDDTIQSLCMLLELSLEEREYVRHNNLGTGSYPAVLLVALRI